MDKREHYVLQVLHQRFGVVLTPVSRRTTKTPDFELVENGERILVAEQKTITLAPRTVENGWDVQQLENGIVESTREDKAPARMGDVAYEAWKQLRGYDCAKVVIVLNEEPLADFKDLVEAYTGQHVYTNEHFGYVNTSSMRIAKGKLAKVHGDIDLFIFIDKVHESKVFYLVTTDLGYEIACRYLDDGVNEIPRPTE